MTPVENNLDTITEQIKQAHILLDAKKDFDLTPILAILDEVHAAARDMPAGERNDIARELKDIGVKLSDLEDKINRNNSELTNLINTLDSA